MNTGPHIAVVDDELATREMVGDYLRMHGFAVTLCDGAASLRHFMARQQPDLVVLDLNMPGEDGLSVVRQLKASGDVPVIMLTATASAIDRIVGLELGADDYLAKPCELRELVARIRSVLRRSARSAPAQPEAGRSVRFGTKWFDIDTHRLRDEDGRTQPLTKSEFLLLKAFADHPRRVLSREYLLDIADARDAEAFDRAIDVRITRIRRKIEPDPANPRFIRTVRGLGYAFEPDGALPRVSCPTGTRNIVSCRKRNGALPHRRRKSPATARGQDACQSVGELMRIRNKIMLVGGIPIAIAAGIAVAAWLLLSEAERARSGAVLAGAIYRDLLVAMSVRDDYVGANPAERDPHAERFRELAARAQVQLASLAPLARTQEQRREVTSFQDTLARYAARMDDYIAVTTVNDRLIAEMSLRAARLVTLAEEARARQHASNADIITTLTEKDQQLRRLRDIVDSAYQLRATLWGLQTVLQRPDGSDPSFALAQMQHAATGLGEALGTRRGGEARELGDLSRAAASAERADLAAITERLLAWCDRLLKIEVTAQRALQEEVAQLLTYSVEANETEQATQNVAVATLRLGQETHEALTRRDADLAERKLARSGELADIAAALPISPLIQTDMIDAITEWRERLGTTIEGIRKQNAMIADMDQTAAAMVAKARSLNDLFTGDADWLGDFIGHVLVIGATVGLLFGSVAAFAAARSITMPLRRLQGSMLALAADPLAGRIAESDRRDELGDMARAANIFVTEISRRERDLRQAKERTDETLAELRQAQADLIQAEKLASLGQLVAGVAHEINTPLGIALTTATLLGDEAQEFERALKGNQLPRSRLAHFLDRMKEGSRLLFDNLGRASDLVHSFKQVAVDQVSDEPRRFEMKGWLEDVIRSLGPLLRKTQHAVAIDCPAPLQVGTYPGALAQVLTNLVINAALHAYDEGESGRIAITVRDAGDQLHLTVSDDGKGIAPQHLGRIFDPFFTTARHRGSTGLGLHIVYNLVTNKLQGRIDVESRPGAGTTFRIEMPKQLAGEARTEAMAAL